MNIRSQYDSTGKRLCQAFFAMILAAFLLGISPPCDASPLVVITADRLSLADIDNTSTGPLTPDDLSGAVIGLVSPGLPNHKAGGPVANLYATLSAGDVVDTSNQFSGLLERDLYVASKPGDVRIIAFGDASTSVEKRKLRSLIAGLRQAPKDGSRAPGILLVGVVPGSDTDQGLKSESWCDLTPIVWLSCGGGSSDSSQLPTLTSDTTQTRGLIALRDVAPTILQAENLPIPDSMSGRPAHVVMFGSGLEQNRDEELMSMVMSTRTNQQALAPFGWIFGIGGGIVLLLAGRAIVFPPRANSFHRYCLRCLLSVPLALLVAPVMHVANVGMYLFIIAGYSLLYGLIPGPGAILLVTSILLMADSAFLGSTLISRTLLSGYWLSGIRFYGIGNEFMGILIGAALLVPVLWQELMGRKVPGADLTKLSPIVLALWYLVVLIVMAYPQFGAKAGGAVAVCGTFVPSLWSVMRRRAPGFGSWIVGIGIGFLSIIAFALLAKHLGGRVTHIQTAVTALTTGKLSTVAHIAIRKAKMAAHVALAPGAVAGTIGVVLIAALWRISPASKIFAEYVSRPDRQLFGWALRSSLWGMLACVLFNDSGVVAALLMFGVIASVTMYQLLVDQTERLAVRANTSA